MSFRRRVRKIESREVKLKRGMYNESSLVDKVCSEAQRRSYHHKEKFASGKHQSMFLDVTLPQAFSDAQYEAVVAAEMFVTAQADGSITISCRGDTPQIDIPILITLLG